MVIQVENAALLALASKIKNGGTIKCDTENDLFKFVMLDANKSKNADLVCKSTSFKYAFKELVAKHSIKNKTASVEFELDDKIEAVLKNNFSLRIGSKIMRLGNKIQPNKEMKIFEGYYFNISNGLLSTDVTSNSFTDGLQKVAHQAGTKFAEAEN